MTTKFFMYFLLCKGLSNDDVGGARDTLFQQIRPGAGFETGDFVKEMLGGATAERLPAIFQPRAGLTAVSPLGTVEPSRFLVGRYAHML